jgi:glycosyltransferase involved in cell wall biosynthesis
LSWGTPVVVTSAGNSGVQAASGQELWVADDPGQFAAHVVSLLRGERWLQLSQAGRSLVAQRFSWQRSAAELEEQLVAVQEIR